MTVAKYAISGRCKNQKETIMSIALTFDDGPRPDYTPQILDILSKYGIKATFFCVGQAVDAHPELVKRASDEGHLVANHSYTHPHLPQLDDGAVNGEFGNTNSAIEKATGKAPGYFRPPFGETDDRVNGIASQLGLNGPILWTVDTNDWNNVGVDAIVNALVSAPDGSNILCHDGVQTSDQTIQAIDKAIPQMQQNGVSFVTVSELLGAGGASLMMTRKSANILIPHPSFPVFA
jgi:peptidoglycan-N-acetylglucosamine deacetylase